MVGLMATSSKRAYAIPRSAAPRAPAPAAGHCWPIPLKETLKHSSGSVSVGSLGPGSYKVCLGLQVSLKHMRFDCKHDCAPHTVLLGLLLCPWMWVSFFFFFFFLVESKILLLMVVRQRVAILEFLQEKMSSHLTGEGCALIFSCPV